VRVFFYFAKHSGCLYTSWVPSVISQFVTLETATLAIAILGVIVIVSFFWILLLSLKLKRFTQGSDAKSLEQAITAIQKRNSALDSEKAELEKVLKHLHTRISGSARGIATVRFNAFDGRGESGSQSFATAILSEKGDGIVISTMHARETTRVYGKPLENFDSEFELTKEEESAIKEARSKLKV